MYYCKQPNCSSRFLIKERALNHNCSIVTKVICKSDILEGRGIYGWLEDNGYTYYANAH